MRSLKTTGGLTRGSGISDVQRAIWLLSKPISLEYGTRMEELSNVLYVTSEQHKTATPSRLKRDREDFQKIQEKLKEFSPFSDDNTLRNIINGVVAAKNVNVDDCFKIGSALIKKMEHQSIFKFSFKRSHKVKNLSTDAVSTKNDIIIDRSIVIVPTFSCCIKFHSNKNK